ncbi:MAG: hypothetical protein WBC74_04395, partial [Candidatus Omnitrophota bacterium]
MKIFITAVILFLCCAPILNAEEAPLALTLDECIQTALVNTQDLLKAEEEIRRSEGYLLEQFSAFLP